MSIEIREARINELERIVDMWFSFMQFLNKINPNYYSIPNSKIGFFNHARNTILNEDKILAIATDNDEILGFILAYIEKLPVWHQSKKIGLIRYCVVVEEHQSQGIGKQLADFTLKWFHKREISRIELYVLDGLEANKFWEKMGFKTLMERKYIDL